MITNLRQKQKTALIPSPHSSTGAFTSEAGLVQNFVSVISNPSSDSFHIVTEFPSANGIADVVIFRKNKKTVSASLSNIPPRWAFALKEIPYRKPFTTEEFCRLALIQPKTAKLILNSFETSGFCEHKDHFWKKVCQPIPVASEIIAIEAKLKDWTRALKQAYRYLDFAHSSWVLLDEKRIEPAYKQIWEFKRLNVGLASISANTSEVTLYFSPKKQKPRSKVRYWQANATLAHGR